MLLAETSRARQMRDLLRAARVENSRKVAEAFRTRVADVKATKASKRRRGRVAPPVPVPTPIFDASEQAGARLLKALNRAAAVEARWKTMSFSGS